MQDSLAQPEVGQTLCLKKKAALEGTPFTQAWMAQHLHLVLDDRDEAGFWCEVYPGPHLQQGGQGRLWQHGRTVPSIDGAHAEPERDAGIALEPPEDEEGDVHSLQCTCFVSLLCWSTSGRICSAKTLLCGALLQQGCSTACASCSS